MSQDSNQGPAGSNPHHGDGHAPHSGVLYFVKVDGGEISFSHQIVTGEQILTKVFGEKHDDYDLYIKLAGGGRKLVEPKDKVDLGAEGIEKFNTIPKTRTDGREGVPQAPMTAEDFQYLKATGLEWEVIEWERNLLLKIKSWPLPPGYNLSVVDVALVIPLTYPAAQLDMFYFFPAVQRAGNVPINALTTQDFFGQSWQRWSRHRTAGSAWRPGLDDIGSHLAFMDACLRDEVRGAK